MYFAQNKHDDTEQVEGYKVEFFAWIANRNVLLLFCTIFDLQTYNSSYDRVKITIFAKLKVKLIILAP